MVKHLSADEMWASAKERMTDHEKAAFEACERVLTEAKKIREEQRAWFSELDMDRKGQILNTIVEETRRMVPEIVERRVAVAMNELPGEVLRRVLGSADAKALRSIAASLRSIVKPAAKKRKAK